MIKPVIKLIRALQSNTAPGEIGGGAALGLYFGLTPLNHTHVIFLVLAFFLFRINRAAAIVVLPLVKLFYVLGLAILADSLGYFLLTDCAFLAPVWSWLTHAPVLAYLDLNHTRVLGGMVIAAIFTIPVYIAVCRGVKAYRSGLREKVQKSNVLKAIKGWTISKWIFTWWPKD